MIDIGRYAAALLAGIGFAVVTYPLLYIIHPTLYAAVFLGSAAMTYYVNRRIPQATTA